MVRACEVQHKRHVPVWAGSSVQPAGQRHISESYAIGKPVCHSVTPINWRQVLTADASCGEPQHKWGGHALVQKLCRQCRGQCCPAVLSALVVHRQLRDAAPHCNTHAQARVASAASQGSPWPQSRDWLGRGEQACTHTLSVPDNREPTVRRRARGDQKNS